DVPHGYVLSKRLSEHADSISVATNIRLDDFRCRWLVVDEVFIPLAESLLISHFKPLWNIVVEGFGNHPPGRGRIGGKKPTWDVLHPGRSWANQLGDACTYETVLGVVKSHLDTVQIPPGGASG
ncbi:MAG: Eco29kI family restriction endonuclease, partial [Limisphaerales bacterium]